MNPYIFIHIPKTGGTSINEVLNLMPTHYRAKFFYKDKENWDNSFKFAFVRNPWDRLFSAYNFAKMYNSHYHSADARKIKEGWTKHVDYDVVSIKTFEEFVLDITGTKRRLYRHMSFLPQNTFLKVNGKMELDFIGRFENLQEDFNKVCEKLGCSEKLLPEMNKSGKNDYKNFYTKDLIDRVSTLYSEDIELFGYKFEEN